MKVNANSVKANLRRLGLPMNLVKFLNDGVLQEKIDEAYEIYDEMVVVMEKLEKDHPELAAALPGGEDREIWKAQGRPRPQWWEVLRVFDHITPRVIRTIHYTLRRPREQFADLMAKRKEKQSKPGYNPHLRKRKWKDPTDPNDML